MSGSRHGDVGELVVVGDTVRVLVGEAVTVGVIASLAGGVRVVVGEMERVLVGLLVGEGVAADPCEPTR